ncbi:MAG: NAD-dependent epimerase/dehydratase family protein [Rhizobacter sp.]|nr:NAD-dependent epimerase/dehydratase family protein [Rhizobacter sp.]
MSAPPTRSGAALRRAAVTGASGFIGRVLCDQLLARGIAVRALVRDAATPLAAGCERCVIGDIARPGVPWGNALEGADAVFHLAAIAHEPRAAPGRLRAVNVDATAALARAAFAQGARVVFASSIKANGEASATPIDERSPLAPTEPYGASKRDAERAIEQAAAQSGGHWIALRPPLVYGELERANFARLVRLALSGLPLPLASVRNRRSMVYAGNLADALLHAASLPAPANRAFVFSDSPAHSIGDWLAVIARAAGRAPRLWPMPPAVLRVAALAAGKARIAQQLLDSLEVDGSAWCAFGAWHAPVAQGDAIAATVRALRT